MSFLNRHIQEIQLATETAEVRELVLVGGKSYTKCAVFENTETVWMDHTTGRWSRPAGSSVVNTALLVKMVKVTNHRREQQFPSKN